MTRLSGGVRLAGGIFLVALIVLSGCVGSAEDPTAESVSTFSSESEFRSYLGKAPSAPSPSVGVGGSAQSQGGDLNAAVDSVTQRSRQFDKQLESDSSGESPRYSTTNVQEKGIQEPDIVKNDGEQIYYSLPRRYPDYYRRGGENPDRAVTRVIDALPPEEAEVVSNVSASGDLFLTQDTLVVVSKRSERVLGYDVSQPKSPEKKWSMRLNSSVVTARLYDGSVYLVLRESIDRDDPCPVRPLESATGDLTVECNDIYRPDRPTPVDVTYHVVSFDPSNGEVSDRVSFVGSSRNSVVYMSKDSIYATYTRKKSQSSVILDFFTGEGSDLLSQRFVQRFERLKSYNLSDEAKMTEIRSIIEDWRRSLGEDEAMEKRNEIQNRLKEYLKKNVRDFERTGIVRIGVDSLEVKATGTVPGKPLNQFSLDEHEGNLRIATTVGGSWTEIGGNIETANDLYVLGNNLEVKGSVKGMGLNERIYSVRFLGDRGYVVTFRRIDPFHVLDLSDPSNPKLVGKLKLPGFSSYLHPLSNDRVLGLGKEDGEVKAVIFDVSNPSEPVVEDDYVLSDYSSDVTETHHAFLIDRRHKVFFVPGSQGGYVFSYDDGLALEKTVSTDTQARRALYIGDYMYVLSNTELVVLNEKTWDRVRTVEIAERREPVHRKPELPQPEFERGVAGDTGVDVEENAQAGVNFNFDATDNTVDVTFVSNQNAEHVNVSISGDADVPKMRLNRPGDRIRINATSVVTEDGACYYSDGGCNTSDARLKDGVEDGDRITVTAVASTGDSETVILDRTGEV